MSDNRNIQKNQEQKPAELAKHDRGNDDQTNINNQESQPSKLLSAGLQALQQHSSSLSRQVTEIESPFVRYALIAVVVVLLALLFAICPSMTASLMIFFGTLLFQESKIQNLNEKSRESEKRLVKSADLILKRMHIESKQKKETTMYLELVSSLKAKIKELEAKVPTRDSKVKPEKREIIREITYTDLTEDIAYAQQAQRTDQLVDDATDNTLAYVVNHMHNNRTATTVLVPKNHQVSTTKSRAKEIRATKVDVIANERQTAQEYMDSLKCKDDNLGKINGNLIKFGEEIVHKKSGEQEVLKKRKNSFLKKTVEKREIKREIAYTDLSEDFAHDQQAKQIDQQSCDEKLFSKKR